MPEAPAIDWPLGNAPAALSIKVGTLLVFRHFCTGEVLTCDPRDSPLGTPWIDHDCRVCDYFSLGFGQKMHIKLTRFLTATALAIVAAAYSSAASAVTCPDACTTYNLIMTPGFGKTTATGTLVLDGTSGHDVVGLDVTLDLPSGKDLVVDFSKQSLANATATVSGGVLTGLDAFDADYSYELIFGDFHHKLNMAFLDFQNPFFGAFDHVTALAGSPGGPSSADPPPATPLPASWTLMLLGLSAFGFIAAWERRRPAARSSLAVC